MVLLPHIIVAQRDTNAMLTRTAEAATVYTTANPGNLLENLKSKYGIADPYQGGADVPITSDIKHISAKYGFGIGQPAQENNYQGDMEKIRSKYGFEPPVDMGAKTHEELLHSEIERTAEDAFRKYGGDQHW